MNSKSVGYRQLHNWVERQLGKPMSCWDCGDTTKARYHWANISGKYERDINDWERLCVPCHQKKDLFGFKKENNFGFKKKDYCARGHPRTPENLYVYKRTGLKECIACRKITHRKRYLKEKAKALVKGK